MASDQPPPEPRKPIRASRWRPTASPRPATSSRLLVRLIAIPALAFAGVLVYRAVQDRLFLPECDSSRAKSTLAEVLKQLNAGPVGDEAIKTISADKKKVVCNVVLPLPEGGALNVDYNFFWQGSSAEMRYAISRKQSQNPPAPPPAAPLR